MIDLRSDTVTKPTPEMREEIAGAEVGDDVFGDDPTVKRLEELVAGLLGKETALYFPSGTQSNQAAIKTLTQPADELIIEAGAHLYNFEGGAPGLLSGVQIRPIQGEYGVISLEQVEEVYSPGDLHRPPTRLICLENTHNRAGGTVFPLDIMERIAGFAGEKGISVHLDGARLFNASVASGVDVRAYARLADTVSICLSKGLGAPVGSCLSGNREVIDRARRMRKIMGGGMRQAGLLAAAGIYALENNVERLAEDHANAKHLAEGIADLAGLRIDVPHVDTNIVIIHLTEEGASSLETVAELKERGVSVVPFGKQMLRAVTHLDVSRTEIDSAIAVFREHFGA